MGDVKKSNRPETRLPGSDVPKDESSSRRSGAGRVPDGVQSNERSRKTRATAGDETGKVSSNPKVGGTLHSTQVNVDVTNNAASSAVLDASDDFPVDNPESFNTVLMREEFVAHFSSLNKMRESLMLGMAKDV